MDVTRVLSCVVAIATTTFALAVPSAHAFFDPPWITPQAPVAGATVSVNLRDGICDAIVEHPGYPQIARQGNAIHVVEYGHHWDDADLCIYDIGHLVEPIGAFAPGDYTVTVDFVYYDYPFGLTTINLGVIPFSVADAAHVVEVPASTHSGLTALLFLMGCLALRGVRVRRGYIYQSCTPEPVCIPPGAQALYRECNMAATDCATFLESERAMFEANGYTAVYPPNSSKKLGYAYAATDQDGDGLPDGLEFVIGTSPVLADSDGDGVPDASEFPLAGVPISDPCAGGVGAIFCPADDIFADGYDGV